MLMQYGLVAPALVAFSCLSWRRLLSRFLDILSGVTQDRCLPHGIHWFSNVVLLCSSSLKIM